MADQQALYAFSQWVAGCSGNEKQEGQTFVQKLLTAWGWADASEAGMQFEHKIPKGGAGGGMGYADALIPGKVLIEMKPRGEALARHFPQLHRYWNYLAPKPTYAILSNFDEFWIYDFNIQTHDPVEQLQTTQLPERWPGLAFLSKQPLTPLFGNNQVAITEKQAAAMGSLFRELRQQADKSAQFTAQEAQRFVLQCVLCMFAEDREMLPNRQFSLALEACQEKNESTYDVLGGLFSAMNTPGVTAGGRFKGTPYFNGGLFSDIPQIELSPEQLEHLISSARENWRQIQPSIFGNIFEASSDDAKRHSQGQHFTSEVDILKIIQPTIIEPWEERIVKATTYDQIDALLLEIREFRILDPACGSGNFLYMAYNALKDLEISLLLKLSSRIDRYAQKSAGAIQSQLGFVSTDQFFGIDIDPFAVELARVTLMIARKVAHDRLGLTEQELPLDNLDKNIIQADALFTPWPEADAIIGNPPFTGGKRIRSELGNSYAEKLYTRYPEVKDSADLCTHWFRNSHIALGERGRAGLVGTNSVRQGISRRASLAYITGNGGWIHNAISSQRWSGDASVHVCIVNWSKMKPHSCMLDGSEVLSINSSLSAGIDPTRAPKLFVNKKIAFQGVIPVGVDNFTTTPELAEEWKRRDPSCGLVLKPFLTADDLTDLPLARPSRWIIDFNNMMLEEAEKFELPFKQVRALSRPYRQENSRESTRLKWWQFGEKRPAMRKKIESANGCFCFPRHSKWFIPLEIGQEMLPGDSTTVIALTDFYILGILTSSAHRAWVHTQKSTLEDRTRYTHTSCFETFPFPQLVTAERAEAIRQQMIELNDYRNGWMVEQQKGITDMYNRYFDEPASKLRKLHDALDALVLKAYGWSTKDDVLAKLLDLNLELAELEAEGRAIVGPWDPNRPKN